MQITCLQQMPRFQLLIQFISCAFAILLTENFEVKLFFVAAKCSQFCFHFATRGEIIFNCVCINRALQLPLGGLKASLEIISFESQLVT